MLSSTSSNSAEWPPVRETAYTLKDLSQLLLVRSSRGSGVRGLRRARDEAEGGGVLSTRLSSLAELELLGGLGRLSHLLLSYRPIRL